MRLRRNAAKDHPNIFPGKRDELAACSHITDELIPEKVQAEDPELATAIFENQFSELTVVMANDGVYRLYYVCPQCKPSSLENFYLEIYPSLNDVSPTGKRSRSKLKNYLSTKNIQTLELPQLFRTHAFGSLPEDGDLIHICEHCEDGRVVIVIQTKDEDVDIQAFAGTQDIEQPTHLITCPDCIADFDPEDFYESIEEVAWDKDDQDWINKSFVIYQAAAEFLEWLYDRLEEQAENLEDYEYDGPKVGEPILLCDHLDDQNIIEAGELDLIHAENESYRVPKTAVDVFWLAACERCIERTKSSYHAAKRKCRKKKIHTWTEDESIKLVIEDLGSDFTFEDGLDVEPLANEICEIFERPDWFFDHSSPAWRLCRDWAPSFFEVPVLPTEAVGEAEIQRAHQAGSLWKTTREKHPTTREEAIIQQNDAITPDDFEIAAIVSIPFNIFGASPDEIAGLESEAKDIEDMLDLGASNNDGVKYQIVTLAGSGTREYHYLFQNKFNAEIFENSFDDNDELDIDIIPIQED